MSDIVERLRYVGAHLLGGHLSNGEEWHPVLLDLAADEIERLRAIVEQEKTT